MLAAKRASSTTVSAGSAERAAWIEHGDEIDCRQRPSAAAAHLRMAATNRLNGRHLNLSMPNISRRALGGKKESSPQNRLGPGNHWCGWKPAFEDRCKLRWSQFISAGCLYLSAFQSRKGCPKTAFQVCCRQMPGGSAARHSLLRSPAHRGSYSGVPTEAAVLRLRAAPR